MTTALRNTGVDVVGEMPWGTHFCLFYETKQDLLDALTPYFKAGLEANEFCLWAISEPVTKEDALDALRRAIPDFDRYLEKRAIEIIPGREWYLNGEEVDLQRITGGWHEKLREAKERDLDGLRISGNAFWLDTEYWPEFRAYEEELDQTIVGRSMMVFCTYPLMTSRPADVLDVARAHQFTLVRRKGQWEMVETPELKQAKQQIKRLNEELEGRVAERTRELEAANAELKVQIAERERIERRLRRSEAHLAEGQRLTHTGSWTWNPTTGQLQWSREHFLIFGFDPDAGEPPFEAATGRVHPEDRPHFDQAIGRAIGEGRKFAVSYRLRFPDGSVKYCQSLGEPLRNDQGEIEYVGTVMDVTERKRAEERLEEAQAEIARVARITTVGELAASIAHEINQPLTAVLANGEAALRWLGRKPPNLKETRAAVKRVVRDAGRAGDVIKHIRALLQKDRPQYVDLDLNEAIREVLALTRSEQQRRGVSVQTELFPGLPPVHGDRIQLQQVILNLVVNGIEAMGTVTDRPRTLRIRTEMAERHGALVAVQDSGVGLDPQLAERIFDPFFTTKPNGMGMGLSISRSIVEIHEGRLWAAPASPHGTLVQFNLPSAQGNAS